MDERDPNTESTSPPDDEEFVRHLLEMAGPRPPVPQEDLDAITESARAAWRSQVQGSAAHLSRRRFPTFALPLAATLAVALGLAAWWLSSRGILGPAAAPRTVATVESVTGSVLVETAAHGPRAITAGEPLPLGASLSSGGAKPGRVSLRLTGGATVRLDVETRLRFVSAAALDLERGAVYVDSGSGRQRAAIEIRTPVGTARELGTRFAVRILESARPALLVRVRDGAVLARQRGRSYLTPAGQQLLLRSDGTAERRAAPSHGPEWDWVLEASPGFDIESRSLRDFLDWVSRETGWRIAYADPSLADSAPGIHLHGSIGNLRPDRAPFAVLPGAGLEGEAVDGELRIRRR
ncbi:MAG TPA: FecR family protein [Thermoanaerobaculia bacterium]|jgi:hypothetical protein|nr:FecR family protein [Thermoanaerobaculia bacterium]